MARYNNYYYRYPYLEYLTLPPLQLCVFIVILLVVMAFSWYFFYSSFLEDFIFQLKLFLLTVPLLLLLLLHLLSFGFSFLVPLPEQDSLHRAGGSPWGVAILLVFFLYVISHQSHYHQRWFPFGHR